MTEDNLKEAQYSGPDETAGPGWTRNAAAWRCPEQSGHPLPAIEAATAATNGSGSKCGRSHRILIAGVVALAMPDRLHAPVGLSLVLLIVGLVMVFTGRK
jgi:hypothetical protein